MNWRLKKIKVSELKEWAKNPRNLTEKGMKDLKKSIEKFGIAEPLVVNSDLTVCGGHGRKKILEELGIKEVDCYLPEKKLTDKQFEELNVRLNKNIGGEWNFDLLANEFNFEDLLNWGFEEKDFNLDYNPVNKEKEIGEDGLKTEHECPQCGYKW
jgi:site-specific DNA-methyltransferase (adenine-specific)